MPKKKSKSKRQEIADWIAILIHGLHVAYKQDKASPTRVDVVKDMANREPFSRAEAMQIMSTASASASVIVLFVGEPQAARRFCAEKTLYARRN